MCGVTSGSPPSVSRRWFESEVRHLLDDGSHNRAAVGIAFSVGGGPDPTACGRGSSPDHARAWDSPDGAMIHVQKVAQPGETKLGQIQVRPSLVTKFGQTKFGQI